MSTPLLSALRFKVERSRFKVEIGIAIGIVVESCNHKKQVGESVRR